MRLGLDIGSSSIGWWLYKTNAYGITGVLAGGVRIFSDGRDKQLGVSFAAGRRAARSARRRRDRYLRRRAVLMRKLTDAGLMPKEPLEAKALEALDPYALRATALDKPLSKTALGRALFHMHQRRGFKSNRKADRGDNESGKIKDATARLDQAMMATGARTYGEFLHQRRSPVTDHRRVPSVRTRLTLGTWGDAEKAETGYDFYPDRRHFEDEFHKIWEAQAKYDPQALTDDIRDALYETLFYQRPLKEPEVGLCLLSDERRAPRAHPVTQRRVLYETVNGLRITGDGRSARPLTRDQRDALIHALDNKKHTKSLSGMQMKLAALAKEIKLPKGERFTLETGNRDAIACDPVRASLSHQDRFGQIWSGLDLEAQWDCIQRIRDVESDTDFEGLVAWLMERFSLNKTRAVATANAPLPEGYARLGTRVSQSLLTELQADVITYSEAVERIGFHHSDQRTGEILDTLPYYGAVLERHVIPGTGVKTDDDVTRFGRISNPTVHIGLNQLRRVVNLIIATYGKPDEIVIELARELKQSNDQKKEYSKSVKKNQEDAIRRGKQLMELGQQNTGANRMLLRLYENLGPAIGPRCCPYTGQTISAAMVFDGSCDIDHILPYSRTLDDGVSNKTLCLREANREKGNKTPWEVWGHTPRWEKIEANLKNLPDNAKWRYAPDAMERFEEKRDFLDRALVDTQYLSRIARTYLDTLYTEGGHVWAVPGRMTEMLRRHWGLNSLLSDRENQPVKQKNRTDHRHHAIDAAVVAATDRGLLNAISRAAGQEEVQGKSAEEIARSIPEPWEGFRTSIKNQLDKVIVSHRADHGRIDPAARRKGKGNTTGQLHNAKAYGVVDGKSVVSRTALLALKPGNLVPTSTGRVVRDPDLLTALRAATRGKEGKAFEQALAEFAAKPGPYQGLRRVRMIESLQESARIEIKGPDGTLVKAYKGDSNHCYEIWRLPDGKAKPQVITTYEANRGISRRPHPAAKRILKVSKRDMVAIEREGRTIICAVQSLDINNGLLLAEHMEANVDARRDDKSEPFKIIQMSVRTLLKAHIRRVSVDEIGRLRDGGRSKKTE
jgi:CRISPR-associated endonuclease Csn1